MSDPEDIYDAPASNEATGNIRNMIAQFNQTGHAYAPGAAMAAKSMTNQQQPGGPPELPSKKPFKPPMSPTGAQMFAIPKGDLLQRKNNLTIQPLKRASARTDSTAKQPPTGRGAGAVDKPKPPVGKKPPVVAPKPGAKPNLAKPPAAAPAAKENNPPNANLLRRQLSDKESGEAPKRKSAARPPSRRVSAPGTILVGNDGKRYKMRPVPDGTGTPPPKPSLPPGKIELPLVKKVKRISRVPSVEPDQEIYDDATSADAKRGRPISEIPTMTEEEEEEFERKKKLYADKPQELYDDIAGPDETYDDTTLNKDPEEQELYEEFDDIIDQESKRLDTTGKRQEVK